MIDYDIKVTMPDIEIETPRGSRFWQAVAIDTARSVRKRTETFGRDENNRDFRPYSKDYAMFRAGTGRSTKPNLSYSGKMLGAMVPGARGHNTGATITLSGEEGDKAWGNEKRGRIWFGLDEKTQQMILDRIEKWMAKANGLT